MDTYTTAWLTKQLAGEPLIPLVIMATPMGERVYAPVHLGADAADSGTAFDGDVGFDAEVAFSGGLLPLEIAARLIEVSGIEDVGQGIASDVVASVGQAERTSLSVELDNRDGELGVVVGQERLLNQSITAAFTFAGLGIVDKLDKVLGVVTRWTLSSRSLRLDGEVR